MYKNNIHDIDKAFEEFCHKDGLQALLEAMNEKKMAEHQEKL